MSVQGSSEELGRPDDLHGQEAEGSDRLNKLQAREADGGCRRPGRLGEVPRADTKEMSRTVVRTRDGKQQRVGRVIRSRSFSKQPKKAGNSTPEDPPEEREKPGHGAEDGKH